ncbi:MAG TPA: hypothetical protein DCM59_04530 [Clostridium sp.]|jgi:hypothetical protein|nr:hypothetical protein [Clostridium sp.]
MTFFRKISFCQGPNSFKQHLFYTLKATGEGYYFDMWLDWAPEQLEDLIYDLPIGEAGLKSVQLALSSLRDSYFQALRGQSNYTDLSYLAQWGTIEYITEISIKIAP